MYLNIYTYIHITPQTDSISNPTRSCPIGKHLSTGGPPGVFHPFSPTYIKYAYVYAHIYTYIYIYIHINPLKLTLTGKRRSAGAPPGILRLLSPTHIKYAYAYVHIYIHIYKTPQTDSISYRTRSCPIGKHLSTGGPPGVFPLLSSRTSPPVRRSRRYRRSPRAQRPKATRRPLPANKSWPF